MTRVALDTVANQLFSRQWAQLLCSHWNESGRWRDSMAGAGEIAFVLDSGDESRTLVLQWDDRGLMSIVGSPQAVGRPEFRAPAEPWAAVMNEEVSPVGAVLRGRVAYKGPLWFAAKYASAFVYIVQAQRQAIANAGSVAAAAGLRMAGTMEAGSPHE